MTRLEISDGGSLDVTAEELVAAALLLSLEVPQLLFGPNGQPTTDEADRVAIVGKRVLTVRQLLVPSDAGLELDENVARAAELLSRPSLLALVTTFDERPSADWLASDGATTLVASVVGDAIWRLRFVEGPGTVAAIAALTDLDQSHDGSTAGDSSSRRIAVELPDHLVAGAAGEVQRDDRLAEALQSSGDALHEIIGSDAILHSVAIGKKAQDGGTRTTGVAWTTSDAAGLASISLVGATLTAETTTADELVSAIAEFTSS